MPLTDKEISEYLVYRIKLNELIHFHLLWVELNSGDFGSSVGGIDIRAMLDSVRTAAMAWIPTSVDRKSLEIFRLWKKMFSQYQKRIELYQTAVQPYLDLLWRFRNKTAFHADPTFAKFFEPRVRLSAQVKEVSEAMQRFLRLAGFLMARENRVDPDLHSRILGVVLSAELTLNCRISRQWLIDSHIVDRNAIYGKRYF